MHIAFTHILVTLMCHAAVGVWSQLAYDTGPSARMNHQTTVDVANERLFLYGGELTVNASDADSLGDDLWMFDFASGSQAQWTLLHILNSTVSPGPRCYGFVFYRRETLLFFGGTSDRNRTGFDAYNDDLHDDLWLLTFVDYSSAHPTGFWSLLNAVSNNTDIRSGVSYSRAEVALLGDDRLIAVSRLNVYEMFLPTDLNAMSVLTWYATPTPLGSDAFDSVSDVC
jgi:hypothetical protein